MDRQLKGMPDRSGIKSNSVEIEDCEISFNPILSDDNTDISYELSGVHNNKIGTEIKDGMVNKNSKYQDILKLNDYAYQELRKASPSFVFNGIGIHTLFSIIYTAVSGNSLIILRDFFNFTTPTEVHKEWVSLDSLSSSANHRCLNLIVVNPKHRIFSGFTDQIHMLLNNKIIKASGCRDINNILPDKEKVSNKFKVDSIVFYGLCTVKPEWKYKACGISKKMFNGNPYTFLYKQNEVIGYTEDDEFTIYEVELKNDWSMGFVLSNDSKLPDINLTELGFYWKLMEYQRVKRLYIPTISFYSKHKYNSLLKQGGISQVFSGMDAPKFINGLCSIDRVIQNNSISIRAGKIGKPSSQSGKGVYIINRPFICYLRRKQDNAMPIIGLCSS